jgi:hypothetical protein
MKYLMRRFLCLFGKHEFIEAGLLGRMGTYPITCCKHCLTWASASRTTAEPP